jgi:hypothetical protein
MNATLTTATTTTTLSQNVSVLVQPPFGSDINRKDPARYDFNRHSQVQTSRHPYLFLYRDSVSNNHEREASRHGRTDHFQRQHPLSSTRPSQPITATRTQVTQANTEEPTTSTINTLSRLHVLRKRLQQHEPMRRKPPRKNRPLLHSVRVPTRPSQAIPASTNPAKYDFNRHSAVLSGRNTHPQGKDLK